MAFKVIAPVLSLVDPDGKPLPGFIEAHLAWLQAEGIHGILVMGTTGEFPSFSVAQRQRYLEAVLSANPGLTVMVNIGAAAMADVLALQAHALSQTGVNQILWMPPFYYPDTVINGLAETLEKVLSHQPATVPFYGYHYPKMSQVGFSASLLNQFPQVAGLKDTSGDFNRMAALLKDCSDKQLFVGSDYAVNQALNLGCAGIISALANVFPSLYAQGTQGMFQGEPQLKQISDTMAQSGKIPALKAYLTSLNLHQSKPSCLPPYRDLTLTERHALIPICKMRVGASKKSEAPFAG